MAAKQFTIDAFLSKITKKKSERPQSIVIIDSDESDKEGLRGEEGDSELPNVETSSCHVFTDGQTSRHSSTELTVTDTSFDSATTLITQASKVCLDVKNPAQKHRAAMSQLFPSSASVSKRPRLSDAYDPTLQCVVFNQQRKKKAARAKPSKVSVMLVPNGSKHEGSKSVPRGKHRKSSMQDKVGIFRTMSSVEVKRAILDSFKPLHSFIYMSFNSSKFSKDTDQDKDGNTIADHGKHGTIYIMEQTDEAYAESTSTNMIGSNDNVASNHASPVVVIDDHEDDETELPPVAFGQLRSNRMNETLDERRELLREQDIAFEEALQIDQAKSTEEASKAHRQQFR